MPYLICERPPESEGVKYYTIAGLPGNPQSPLSMDTNFGVHYDLKDIAPGTYNIRVSACNDWQCSLPSPLDFTVPEPPSVPIGLGISWT